jgi:type IV pilus assembly protein PilY1
MNDFFKPYQKVRRLLWQLMLGLGFAFNSIAVMAGTVAQTPLFITTNIKPNIMLMVDDSGSMSTTVATPATVYNPATTYLASANCPAHSLPSTSITTISLSTRTLCEGNGGIWSTKRGRCNPKTKDINVPIVYTSTVTNNFIGKVTRSGRTSTTGTLCFDASKNYTTNSSITFPSDVTSATQRANYLNWLYKDTLDQQGSGSTRMTIAKDAAIGLVNSLDQKVRMGLSSFNVDNGGRLIEVIDDLGPTKKSNIINRITALTPNSWTPLAETTASIGRYFATGNTGNVKLRAGLTGETTPTLASVLPNNLTNSTAWQGRTAIPASERSGAEPTFSTAPVQQWCQKCFTVLVTDGLPTQDQDISADLQDYDGDCSGANSTNCLSASPNYDLKKAFYSSVTGDNTSDYLDDVAMALSEMDLRADLVPAALPDGTIPAKKTNMITYAIGLADPTINPTLPGVNPLLKTTADKADGKFYFAGNSAELTASLQLAFDEIIRRDASSSSVAANSTQFRTGALLFQALFNSTNWSGNIRAFNLITEDANDNGRLDSGEDTNGNGKLDAGGIGAVRWNADVKIPAVGDRHIFSFNALTGVGIVFDWGNLNITQKTVLDSTNASSGTSSPVLNFLRGDRSREGTATGDYRERSTVLGDIVNSDPHFVSDQDFGYNSLTGVEGSSYPQYVREKRDNPEVLYVGANDGMLHAFNVQVNNSASVASDEGEELFAYVPNAVISQELATLKDQGYVHRYFVDGSPQSGDVYYDGEWHTILVGGMGGANTTPVASSTSLATGVGGRGIFALDISKPTLFDQTDVLWEFTNRQDVDFGYSLHRASIARMNTGQWVAIVANGYNSANGKAVLYILDIKTGALIKKIVADNGTGNGLSGPTPVDVDGDKIVDYIYAGDLKGNLWKFDVTSSAVQVLNSTAADQWKVAYSGSPVFVAVDSTSVRQPITVIPAVTKATDTTAGQTSGTMIYFGTGKYFESGDHSSTGQQTQSFYGIWDLCDKSSPTTCNGVISGRSNLQEQKITLETSRTFTGLSSTITEDIRVTTNCDVAYGATGPTPTTTGTPCNSVVNRKGWFLDLIVPSSTNRGERVISTPIIRNDAVIFPTLLPIDVICQPSGSGWLMEMALNGSRFGGSPIDLNKDGTIDDDDLVLDIDNVTKVAVSGLKSKVGIIKTPAVINCESGLDCKYLTGSSGELMDIKEKAPGGGGGGGPSPNKRISWRQLQ